ncbi:LysR family transcriptional regulator [Vibrio viridaestus]|uniref:LysR family transcriptional regulator n=1 Tax=Vibrio viridaestus TaxID=2487322 RepID=A0A3N9TIF7_9VIBR|nr:LysR family transcriptional regulator [Vibrio viridaestus]RQW64077.1 LysR family transcriptional regulator [Vibrio viridaestus]
MLSLEQIKMVVLAAELGSFSACARKLGKVQSAVSHGINSLEIDLGVELFDRSSRNPRLTAEGERLLRSAKALLAQSDELERIAGAINRKEEGSLKVGFDDGLRTSALNQLLHQFSEKFPYIRLELMTIASPDIIAEVASGDIDLGIMFSEVEAIKRVDFCYIGSVDFIPVCHAQFPLANLKNLSASDLVPYRQLAIRGRSKQESQSLVSMSPNVWWCTSHYSILDMVRERIGWAYLPSFLADTYLKSGELAKINVTFDHKPWSVPVDLVFRQGREFSVAYEWLFEKLKGIYAG